jgi:hypothetical protein
MGSQREEAQEPTAVHDDPLVNQIPPGDLRPTQMTLGFREVEVKRREWRDAQGGKRQAILGKHAIPTVLGPKDRHYVVDHHHMARALMEEKVDSLFVYILADLSALPKDEFWTRLDNSGWCHAYDAKGKRCALSDIPKSLAKMDDDPYRSLAGALRRSGGYAKTDKPFAEFIWADYLRRRIELDLVTGEFATALTQALQLAKAKEATSLPGWCGVSGD